MAGSRWFSRPSSVAVGVIVLIGVVIAESPVQDIHSCGIRMLNYYQELGCRPNFAPGDFCPDSFDCSRSFVGEPMVSRCSMRGQEFPAGSLIPSGRINLLGCRQDCTCQEDTPGHPVFSCPSQQCEKRRNVPQGCYESFKSLESCCVDRICCNLNTTAPRPMCRTGDKVYELGQKFSPEGYPCRVCLCQEGYDGSVGAPWCRQSMCDLETVHRDMLRWGCAPIFGSDKVCCPEGWRCPSRKDHVVATTPCTNNSSTSEPQCYFGQLVLGRGQKVSDDPASLCVTCSCETPPQLTCRRVPRPQCFSMG